jgi:Subtilase family
MNQPNFLIGRGELLTHDIKGPKRGGEKSQVYTLAQARDRLLPQITNAALSIDALPQSACPADFAVARLAMNPSFIARSYFPTGLLRAVGLESIGSRTVKLTPEAWTKKGEPRESTTTELFVAGKRKAFREMAARVQGFDGDADESADLTHVERFAPVERAQRMASYGGSTERFFEVGLHLIPDEDPATVQIPFITLASRLGVKVHTDLDFTAGNLWFVPVEGLRASVEKLAEFAFVRVIRPVPKLRGLRPTLRTPGIALQCSLPTEQALSSEPRVAILDGGLPEKHQLGPWLRSYRRLDEKAADDTEGPAHGLAVTSAFLFGPIRPGGTGARPFAAVDHLRVLDDDANTEDPLELYRTLGFVEQVLLSRSYDFINLSLGPDLPIEDTEVHAWTSVIDDLLRDGETLMTVAAGNNGERDRPSGNARIQVPADCVNAIAVGAANAPDDRSWTRASYSAVGPGRSCGVIKPDLMAFGGDPDRYFHVLTPGGKPQLGPQIGTSFAAPYLLRSAVGVRAILGTELSPLAIRALLVHAASPNDLEQAEVGWGKVPEDIMSIITCPDGTARVAYQGELKPGKYLRATLPLPAGGLAGRIRLRATFCYASPTDPQDAAAYTRAGLEVVFRPHDGNVKDGKSNATTKGFFDLKKYATEQERQSDLGKWETVLHGDKGFLGSSLSNPVFDIHYNAREAGGRASAAEKIRYALIISVHAPKHADLYNEILRAYATTLIPIRPQVSLPIRV